MPNKKLTIYEFICKANKIHHNKYNYDNSIYLNNKTNIIIICQLHGSFFQSPSNHLQGQGCPKCKFEKIASQKRSSIEAFILKANITHKNKYNYSRVNYINCRTKIDIICPIHGEFLQSPNNHLNGRGCRKCQYELLSNITISKGQQEFVKYLQLSTTNITIDRFVVDGYDSKINTIYEFLGDYWHGNPLKFNPTTINPTDKLKRTFGKLYSLTLDRFNKLKNMGFSIKYIWESDWIDFKKKHYSQPNIIIYE